MHAIFQSLPGLMNELSDDKARGAVLAAVWPKALGEQLRERSAIASFIDGILTVAVESSEWKREFEEHAAEIVYKLNRALSASVVARIEFKTDRKSVTDAQRRSPRAEIPAKQTSMPKSLKESFSKIADPELRANFMEAAAACIERRDAQ